MAFVKLVYGKAWLTFAVIVTAAGLGGGAYAAWTASLHVEGTLKTGNVDVVWDQQEDREFVEILQPDGTLAALPVPEDKQGTTTCRSDLEPDSTSRIVKVEVHLADLEDFDAMDAAYREFFAEHEFPARTTTESRRLFGGSLVEITCQVRR